MVSADSHGISRAPCYLGTSLRGRRAFAYRAITFCGLPFQACSANSRLCNSSPGPAPQHVSPTTSIQQRRRAITLHRFGLIPFRSPLLRESSFLSIPRGTEMFQFPRLPHLALCVQTRVTEHYLSRVSPFGYPRIEAYLTAPRGFSQPIASFFGS